MKKKIFFVCISLVLFLLIISCKSSPSSDKKTESPSSGHASENNTANSTATAVPVTPPVSVTSVSTEMLADPMGRADAARKRAVDFECPAYFPSEWEDADSQYVVAANMPKTTQNNVQQAAVMYDNSADAYDEIFRKTIPLYAQAKEDEIMAARERLINTGFRNYFHEYLQEADDKALSALSQYEAGDYYTARDTADDALKEYEKLYTGAEILLVRREIIERDFVKYDADSFEKADEAASAVDDEYKSGNRETAIASAEDVLRRYNNVLANGWKAYAGEKRTAASLEREQALNEKANIASRDIFNEADRILNQAGQSFASQNYRNAGISFSDSEARFSLSRLDTEEKRQRALEIIKIAEEKIEESNETAIDAERVIEGAVR
jgi:hypothetical protein